MKVIKYGDGYPRTIVCDNCHSELEYNYKDIYSWTDELDEFITTGIITCPVCGKHVMVYQYTHPRPQQKKWWWQK